MEKNTVGFHLFQNDKSSETSKEVIEIIDSEENSNEDSVEGQEESELQEKEDPQSEENIVTEETGAETEITEILISENTSETEEIPIGIDVSKFQGTIDWAKVAETGIDFAMVRVGYRTQSTGEITEDTNARYNMQEATANGIRIGAYFFSTAISGAEAVEEAKWVADYISQYQITYPVAYNCEGFDNPDNRQYEMSVTERTDAAIAFLHEIYNQGYTPMFYASKSEMEQELKWETSRIENRFKIWVSQYPQVPYPETSVSSYSGKHDMWQYTNNGTVAGIDKPVDVNVAYFGYEQEAQAQNQQAPENAEADVEALMNFTELEETVTAKIEVNLRKLPSVTNPDAVVVATLKAGEVFVRTGVNNEYGWSRVEYNGQTLYCVSSYLNVVE